MYLQLLYGRALHDHPMRKPRLYLFRPPKTPEEWYDLPDIHEYDYHHRRPIRASHRNLESNGMLHTAAVFERGCIYKREDGIAPWKFQNNYDGSHEAKFVYLSPQRQDITFAKWNQERHWGPGKVSWLSIGDSWTGKMPLGYGEWAREVFAWTKERAGAFRSHTNKRIGRYLNTQAIIGPRPGKVDILLAGNLGSRYRQRHPTVVQRWLRDEGVESRVFDPATSTAFLDELQGRYYVVATAQEGAPFDILLAQARGMIPVLPDIPLFRRLQLEKAVFYPAVGSGHYGVRLNTLDARTWFRNAFRDGRLKRPN